MQITAAFGGMPLAELARLGLRIYLQVPDFRDRCPLCAGAGCSVRHGLYLRRVVDDDGSVIERFPIPRFRCRRRGRCPPLRWRTFSLLPAALVPRRRFSLSLMLFILNLLRDGASVPQVLDQLAAPDGSRRALLLEETAIYRLLALFACLYDAHLAPEPARRSHQGRDRGATRRRALAVAEVIGEANVLGSDGCFLAGRLAVVHTRR